MRHLKTDTRTPRSFSSFSSSFSSLVASWCMCTNSTHLELGEIACDVVVFIGKDVNANETKEPDKPDHEGKHLGQAWEHGADDEVGVPQLPMPSEKNCRAYEPRKAEGIAVDGEDKRVHKKERHKHKLHPDNGRGRVGSQCAEEVGVW